MQLSIFLQSIGIIFGLPTHQHLDRSFPPQSFFYASAALLDGSDQTVDRIDNSFCTSSSEI